jgi:hypothetical protein
MNLDSCTAVLAEAVKIHGRSLGDIFHEKNLKQIIKEKILNYG